MTAPHEMLREWGRRFRRAPLAARVVASLDGRAPEIWRRTFGLLQRESPEYRNSVDEEFTNESQGHCKELLLAIVAVAKGRTLKPDSDPFVFVRRHAEWRARHQVPLIASLQAYRIAHKTYGQVTRELLLGHSQREEALLALAMLSDFWIEFFDYVGAVLAEAHAVEEGLNVARSTRAYASLIDDLLRGQEPVGVEARRLRTLCGIRPGAPLAVAVARPLPTPKGDPADLEATLRSLLRLFQQTLHSSVLGKVVGIRDSEVIAIVCSQSNPGRALLKVLRRPGLGLRAARTLSAVVGVSRDTSDVSRLPEYLHEARVAVEFTGASHPLMQFADIELTELLIRRADQTSLRLIPDWARSLTESGGNHSGDLARTIHAFAQCSLNVKETARRLGVHPNTIYFRLNQISKLTGTDPRTFSGMSLLTTALRLLDAAQGVDKRPPDSSMLRTL